MNFSQTQGFQISKFTLQLAESPKLPTLNSHRLYEAPNSEQTKSYGMGLESKSYWVEKEQIRPSSINRSSVPYNILNHGKNTTYGRIEPIRKFEAHKKESVSKIADLQNTYHHRQCELHKVC